jgi:hypothetical protein
MLIAPKPTLNPRPAGHAAGAEFRRQSGIVHPPVAHRAATKGRVVIERDRRQGRPLDPHRGTIPKQDSHRRQNRLLNLVLSTCLPADVPRLFVVFFDEDSDLKKRGFGYQCAALPFG